jgi:hypothetical protein
MLFSIEELVAPTEIIGEIRKPAGGNKTSPRTWTKKELDWVSEKRKEGYSNNVIANALGRSEISLQIKLKRVNKTLDNYNRENRPEKYAANKKFLDLIQPKSVLDVYAGNSWWREQFENTVTNDKDSRFSNDYQLDALDLLCKIKIEGKKFDIVDLDPYGSAYDQFDLALKIAKRGLIVSFGEWGHKRWKRFDFVKPRYGINNVEEYGNGEPFINELQRIAACNKRLANPVITVQYANFIRVYFTLEEMKITEQWKVGSKDV